MRVRGGNQSSKKPNLALPWCSRHPWMRGASQGRRRSGLIPPLLPQSPISSAPPPPVVPYQFRPSSPSPDPKLPPSANPDLCSPQQIEAHLLNSAPLPLTTHTLCSPLQIEVHLLELLIEQSDTAATGPQAGNGHLQQGRGRGGRL